MRLIYKSLENTEWYLIDGYWVTETGNTKTPNKKISQNEIEQLLQNNKIILETEKFYL